MVIGREGKLWEDGKIVRNKRRKRKWGDVVVL
jgi:hypothetical protein